MQINFRMNEDGTGTVIYVNPPGPEQPEAVLVESVAPGQFVTVTLPVEPPAVGTVQVYTPSHTPDSEPHDPGVHPDAGSDLS